MQQIAPFFQIFTCEHAPVPPYIIHGFRLLMHSTTLKIIKKILGPPYPNPGYAYVHLSIKVSFCEELNNTTFDDSICCSIKLRNN